MAFTRPWDATFPPDTQQANLLGQDIRRDKEDTAERIRAFGAGKIANRETPEADFGNANIGALFFAEDEDKLYRWNGTSWILIRTFDRLVADSSQVILSSPSAGAVGNSITIPAGIVQVGDVIDIFFHGFGDVSSHDVDCRIGGVGIVTFTIGGSGGTANRLHAKIKCSVESLTSLKVYADGVLGVPGGSTAIVISLVSTVTVSDLSASFSVTSNNQDPHTETVTFEGLFVTVAKA